MNRLKKKCFLFSLGLHGLLAGIIVISSGFQSKPKEVPVTILSMIPPNLLDKVGANGGGPVATLSLPTPAPTPAPQPPAQPEPAPPRAKPVAVQPRPRLQTPRQQRDIAPEPTREPVKQTESSDEESRPISREALLPSHPHKSKPVKQTHEVHVTYGMAAPAPTTHHSKAPVEPDLSQDIAAANARAEAHRLKQVESALNHLAVGVQTSASARTVIDANAFGGESGEVFAGYRDAIFNAYYHAFVAPDNTSDPSAAAEARITVARDGTIISAELTSHSGAAALDRSAERALRAVTHLPAFPAGAQDEQRVFKIRFSLDLKQSAG